MNDIKIFNIFSYDMLGDMRGDMRGVSEVSLRFSEVTHKKICGVSGLSAKTAGVSHYIPQYPTLIAV